MGNDIQKTDAMKKILKSVAEEMKKISKKRVGNKKNLEEFKKVLMKLLKEKGLLILFGIKNPQDIAKAIQKAIEEQKKMDNFVKKAGKLLDDPQVRAVLIEKKH